MMTMPTNAAARTLAGLIASHARKNPEKEAILSLGGSPLSYSGLFAQIESTVSALNARGIGPSDRVALVLPNGPEMAVAFVAVASGATCAPLNPGYKADEFAFYLSDLDAKALIVQQGVDSPARGVAAEKGVPLVELTPVENAAAGTFSLDGAAASSGSAPRFSSGDDVGLVLHTSGTTARPKIVPLTQANLCASASHIAETLALTPSDLCLNVMPLFHIHGLIGALLSTFAAGAGVVATPGFDAMKFFSWLDECHPTWYTAVPTMHQLILSRAGRNQDAVRNAKLRLIRSSSASLPPQVMRELEQVFRAPVIESYGMTEATHQMASNPLPPRARKPGSVGPAAGPDVAIMNQAGELLEANQTAEIVIRGPNVTQGYERNPDANAEAFTNGWFRTGDQGYVDDDGYLFITGRLKELINRGGEKISPREVDEVLLDHPSVQQAVTFALPHKRLGEAVAAAIVLNRDTAGDERDIRDFARQRLAEFKVPSKVVFVDTIPKGPTGKLQRIGLAEKLGLS